MLNFILFSRLVRRHKRVDRNQIAATLAIMVLLSGYFTAQGWASGADDLNSLSLEDLMRIEVTSVSKKSEKLSDAPAAIFVISQEDIRRSGATTIPDALRMVPGIEVARIDSNKWAISSRGFQTRFANKLLVLIDGRTLYSSLFSGVWWDVQDILLEDIDRIEVIRGPGATLWGANAVNGVINIITKKAADTQDSLATAGGGTFEKGFGSSRFGMKMSDQIYARGYAKYFNRDTTEAQSGLAAADQWRQFRTGFRMDRETSTENNFTLQGDFYRGNSGNVYDVATLIPPYSSRLTESSMVAGGNILGRWNHAFSNTSGMTLQAYYDRTERHDAFIWEDQDTIDFDMQHRLQGSWGQDIVWGLGYRFVRDDIQNNQNFSLTPARRNDQLFNAFIQDEITLIPNTLRWTIGTKLEHNDYTGVEFQPSTRLLWAISPNQSAWAAISKSVRTPSRVEYGLTTNYTVIPPGISSNPGPLPILVQVQGNPDFRSEEMISYEVGYRAQPTNRFSLDLATYYNQYSNLRLSTLRPSSVVFTQPPYVLTPIVIANGDSLDFYGAELSVESRVLESWRLKGSYAYAEIKGAPETSLNKLAESFGIPRHQLSLRSLFNLTKNIEADAWLRYVDNLQGENVPAYTTLDLRLAWHPVPKLELALVGQNLLQDRHQEFRPEQFISQTFDTQRSVYGKLTFIFKDR